MDYHQGLMCIDHIGVKKDREGIIITSPGRVEHPNTVQKPFKGESEEFIQMRRPANGENPPTAPELSCT